MKSGEKCGRSFRPHPAPANQLHGQVPRILSQLPENHDVAEAEVLDIVVVDDCFVPDPQSRDDLVVPEFSYC
jgi:hypothetical protein